MVTLTILGLGLALMILGTVMFFRERRRVSHMIVFLAGLLILMFSLAVFFEDLGTYGNLPLVIIVFDVVVLLLGYPILAIFLVGNGIQMIRRERISLANLLSLLTGILMLFGPIVPLFLPTGGIENPVLKVIAEGTLGWLLGVGAYFGFCFAMYAFAAAAYRIVPKSKKADYVVVLGSGLIGDQVTPLLASRLDKGVQIAAHQQKPAYIVPSGGQGGDEKVAEGVAMKRYLVERGVPECNVLVEDRARNTQENLLYSQKLIGDPDADLVIVTNSYHVFRTALMTRALDIKARVFGSRTAAYFVPSAVIREFIAVMSEHKKLHSTAVALWAIVVYIAALPIR